MSTSLFNPLSANNTKWSNTLKQFVGKFPTNCLSVFDHFVGLAPKGLKNKITMPYILWKECFLIYQKATICESKKDL